MDATRNQYEFANAIFWRNKERLNTGVTGVSVRKEQVNDLYYWIMRQMMVKVENCWSAEMYHELDFVVERPKDGAAIQVVHRGRNKAVSEVFIASLQLGDRQFFEVVEEVANIIDSLPRFTANYYYTERFCSASLRISMSTV